MKKFIFMAMTLMAFVQQGNAQKYLDIYRNGHVVSSVATADIDSMIIGDNADERSVDFYHNGELLHHTTTSRIDSIKVFRAGDEPLVYLGIVGFNQELYEKPFGVLHRGSASEYKSFINGLTRKDGTLLYYGVDYALDMLTKQNFPTSFTSVNMITFTDGLDQGSLMMNGSYTTDEQYMNAVNQRIKNTTVKGLPLTAYSLGLRGSDVTNYSLFQSNLKKLASSDDKAFEVSSMSAVRSKLQEISDRIISISNKQTFSMKIPGQSNGTLIRFTFDGNSATNSSLYIEGTFNLSDRSLRNVVYQGIKSENGSFVQGKQDGIFVTYTFPDLQREDGNGLIPTSYIKQYYKLSEDSPWQVNSEFTPDNNMQTNTTYSGTVILLVLDCSSSLGSQFGDMQSYAKDFIDRVAENAATHIDRPFGNNTGGIEGNHEWVDLGLPSGTLWATCNVGASSSDEYGLYFAWGETQGYTSDTSDGHSFDWASYKWCDGSYDTMTKYCTKSSYGYNGFTDGQTELLPEDDAATANWGDYWRMPTIEQMEELINSDYTTTEWTTLNGVKGRKITSKSNGNSIFLPAAGYRYGASLGSAGSCGYYWSRSLSTNYSDYACRLYFGSGYVSASDGYRSNGRSIRPVRVQN